MIYLNCITFQEFLRHRLTIASTKTIQLPSPIHSTFGINSEASLMVHFNSVFKDGAASIIGL